MALAVVVVVDTVAATVTRTGMAVQCAVMALRNTPVTTPTGMIP